jgi:DNA primase
LAQDDFPNRSIFGASRSRASGAGGAGSPRSGPAPATRTLGDRSDIDKVKDATDLVRLIGEHIALRPKGREYICLCPFHDDHSPSMYVVPEKQFYKCFSCGASGDCFGFVQNFLKMDFRDALEFLADRAGVQLTPLKRSHAQFGGAGDGSDANDATGGGGVDKKALLAASSMANAFFRAVLKHEEHGKAAREVIERRGVSAEMVELFQLGASPDRWDGLLLTASKQGVATPALLGAGLIKARDSGAGGGGHYDAFRNRLMFPIHDRGGRVIAFGARKIDPEDEPKYLNSPETRLFNKSATLYALPMALREIQATRTAIICEGYMDVIACHQGGFKNAVATLGTALTRDHAKQLRLACDRIVLLFDGDEAGQRATDRAAEVFFAEPVDVAVVTLSRFTDAKDPDELLKREDGAEVFREALAHAQDVLEYRFARIREKLAGAGMAALAKAMNEELQKLVDLGLPYVEPMRQALIVRRLAGIAGISEQAVRAAIPAGRNAKRTFERPESPDDEPASQVEVAELAQAREIRKRTLTHAESLLGCLLCEGRLWMTLAEADKDAIAPVSYDVPVLQRVAQAVHDLGEDGQPPSLHAVLSHLEADGPSREATIGLAARIDEQTERNSDRLKAYWHFSLSQARRDAASGRGAVIESKPADETSATNLAAKARTLADLHRTLGPDRRRIPRPGG